MEQQQIRIYTAYGNSHTSNYRDYAVKMKVEMGINMQFRTVLEGFESVCFCGAVFLYLLLYRVDGFVKCRLG